MTTPDDRKPVTNAELYELWERQDQRIDRLLAAQENTEKAISDMRVREEERAARHDKEMAEIRADITAAHIAQDERAARHDKEMAEIRAAITAAHIAQDERAARHDKEMAVIRAAITAAHIAQDERAARHDKEMAEIRADITAAHIAQDERAARHDKEMAEIRADITAAHIAQDERAARHDKEMAVIRAGIADLTRAQDRTNQDVSTLKGWGLELYCKRNPEIFAESLGLRDEELIPKREIRRIAGEARQAGVITLDQSRSLSRADVFIYARRDSDYQPLCLVVEASYRVDDEDVNRAAARAAILGLIIQKYQPRNLNGQAVPIVAGTDIATPARLVAQNLGVTYVPVQNGNQLTNPPE